MNLLNAQGLSKTFPGPRPVKGLDNVSISIAAGETLGLVGPSGSGKSTLARVVARLTPPDQGEIRFAGQDWLALKGAALRRARAGMQMVFQDPAAAFHPRATVDGAIAEALRIHRIAPRADWPERIAALLEQVGLPPDLTHRRLTEISGGQRQRVALARALACAPKLIILDEAVSALDASVRARIVELLVRVQNQTGVAYLFVSHDLALMRQIAHRTAVMEAGRIIETGPTLDLIAAPQTELTRRLIAAIPELHKVP
ncbi:ABC transporter ATP-binding protein [Paracoccus aminophilus]|uniref:Peptide/nickel transport system, ATP-binding protein n=1 Tax=Paracoccus aminophilus JCM 7686 TaxID=1367847 RepID=S5XVT7_PARAH|nr:ATP-binding cassette domain-containing protein [Paracoccus aminophilus]AGT09397.1 peptide/nickel transport system, ATP-binding protein [Paracoccus aminophilus JCM 7686]